ncbi:hypothetical protein X753_21760 [Mesorhizobium sp. LNJC399B00]|uniref:DUF6074 family protein n=1 Tax=unclassified Mesorhizobium TaxID=325217 RepID=UPI0003CEF148|nr:MULTISPECIES: DUF6074 family protein [unclassified Mesorhizobium]ESY03903.1 hypothetical protein X753_21760 [Mesorhizobium sp. LNJC399B00]WJI68951.1 DUF6074 family protein [Mesorhizobium sp. C399B]
MPKDQSDQLSMIPLFERTATILWFPIRQRRQVARGAARRLLAAPDRPEQQRRWRCERGKLRQEMRALGLDDGQIAAELRRFFDVVGFEAWKISRVPARESSDGGAA